MGFAPRWGYLLKLSLLTHLARGWHFHTYTLWLASCFLVCSKTWERAMACGQKANMLFSFWRDFLLSDKLSDHTQVPHMDVMGVQWGPVTVLGSLMCCVYSLSQDHWEMVILLWPPHPEGDWWGSTADVYRVPFLKTYPCGGGYRCVCRVCVCVIGCAYAKARGGQVSSITLPYSLG